VIRRLAALAALVLMLPPALAAQEGGSAAMRELNNGKEHLRRDEFMMAVKSFTKYASLAPNNKLPYDLRACAYLRMDSVDLALKDIATSQRIDANEQTGYFANWLSGIALMLQGDSANAEVALAKAASGSPDIAGRRIARARANADLQVGGEGGPEQSELYSRRLAELLLDECIDRQLLGQG